MSKLRLCQLKSSPTLERKESDLESSECIISMFSTMGSPTPTGYSSVQMNPHLGLGGGAWLAIDEEESKVSRIIEGYVDLEGSDSTEGGCLNQILHSQGTLGDGKQATHGDILVWLMWVEEQIDNRRMQLMAMEYLDLHSYMYSHHRCIQHRVKVPIVDQKLNIDDHVARWHPLKTTQKHGSEKYKIS